MANSNLNTKFLSMCGGANLLIIPWGTFIVFCHLNAPVTNHTYPTNHLLQEQVVNNYEGFCHHGWPGFLAFNILWMAVIWLDQHLHWTQEHPDVCHDVLLEQLIEIGLYKCWDNHEFCMDQKDKRSMQYSASMASLLSERIWAQHDQVCLSQDLLLQEYPNSGLLGHSPLRGYHTPLESLGVAQKQDPV